MFTGIVETTAKLVAFDEKSGCRINVIELPKYMIGGLKTGASIANNGCCLTVKEIQRNYVSFELVKETLRITNLGTLVEGNLVNIERSVRFGDEIGGHLMSGHIITTAAIEKIFSENNQYKIWLKMKDQSLMKYIMYKGFIGIDGISLTVGEIIEGSFCVYLIPETLKRTTLGLKKVKEQVNIEINQQTQAIVDTVERIHTRSNRVE